MSTLLSLTVALVACLLFLCVSYFFFTFMVALIGIVLFSIAVKRYKYRERDDRPYNQSVVEEIFYRRTLTRPVTPDYDE